MGIKKDAINYQKGKRNSISSMYNIGYNPDLDVDKAVVRRILRSCRTFIEHFDPPWDINTIQSNQKKCVVNTHFYSNVFKDLKD